MKDSNRITNKKMEVFLREKLSKNAKWQIGGLLNIYSMQTAEEKQSEATIDYNGVGFTGVDGEILASFSKQVTARTKKCRWCGKDPKDSYQCKECKRLLEPLSYKQMMILIKKMPKYWKQIWDAAKFKDNGETLKKAYWKDHPQISLF